MQLFCMSVKSFFNFTFRVAYEVMGCIMAFSYIWVIGLRSHWTLPHVRPAFPANWPPSFSQTVLPSIFMLHRLHFALSFLYLTGSHSFSHSLSSSLTHMHTHIHIHIYAYLYALNRSENTQCLSFWIFLFNIKIFSYIHFHENLIILHFFMPEKVSLCIYYPSIIWWMFRLIPLPSNCEERNDHTDVQGFFFLWWDIKSFGCEGCDFDM